jgi:putative NADH-flavin reductase
MNTIATTLSRQLQRAPQQLAVFGATNGVGRRLTENALDAGHRVTALVRNPSRMPLEHSNLTLIQGDATEFDAVQRTVRGSDAVVCALGAPALSRSRVRSQGTQHIVDAMGHQAVRRLLCVSVLGAGDSREVLTFGLRYLLFPLYLRRAVAEHERQEAIIRQSGLDWTIVRPPTLTDGPATGAYLHGFGNDRRDLSFDISRADVAAFLLGQLAHDRYLREAVGVSYAR